MGMRQQTLAMATGFERYAKTQPDNTSQGRDAKIVLVFILCICGFLFCLSTVWIGWKHSLFDFYGSRQAQTALTSYYMMQGSGILHYETPVLGPPWSIPFEFPLYQWLTACASGLLSTPLEPTGRLVSVFFYFLTFIPLADALLSMRFSRLQTGITLALFAASPYYIFNSRCFLIESTALFFSIAYIALLFRLFRKQRPWLFAAVAIFGALAGLVKVTTFATFLILGSVAVAATLWQEWKEKHANFRNALAMVTCAIVLPFAITAIWTHFADGLKSQNPLAAQMTSQALTTWNFGTLGQRLVLRNYFRFGREVNSFVGNLIALFLALVLGTVFRRRIMPAVIASLALYMATIEIFFNLHYVHVYYAYANAIFVIVAAGIVLGAVVELPGWRGWLGAGAFALMLAWCGYTYFFGLFFQGHSIYQIQSKNAPGRPQAAALIDQFTHPQDVIVVFGPKWFTEIPYQAQRRSIMDPFPDRSVAPLVASIEKEGPAQISAVVACDEARGEKARIRPALELSSMPDTPQYSADDCDIYFHQPVNKSKE